MKRITGLLVLLGVALLVFFLTREAYRPDAPAEQVTETVLLERIRPVLKLVTVEGDLSEVFTYSDNSAAWFDWTRNMGWNRKQAILLVQARASVGYDLDGLGLSFDEATRTVRLTGMAAPKLLALEHDVKYFDLQEGAFADFSAADHTRMQAQAKARIEQRLPQSGLFEAAAKQKEEFLVVLRAVVENGGWTLAGDDRPRPVKP